MSFELTVGIVRYERQARFAANLALDDDLEPRALGDQTYRGCQRWPNRPKVLKMLKMRVSRAP